jgi:predicted P-loop ATPase
VPVRLHPVFEGKQGRRSSTALRVLAVRSEWFRDRLSPIGSTRSSEELVGKLIAEISEMDAINRASPSSSKSFLTRREEDYVPPWGRRTILRPQQNVFAATINPDADKGGRYLKDRTGGRRYWPFLCRDIDVEALKRDLDQLWGEAVARYRNKEPWYLNPELEALAAIEQEKRTLIDDWQPEVRQWIDEHHTTETTMWQVFEHALGFHEPSEKTIPYGMQKRMRGILERLGFKQCRPRGDGPKRPPRLYRKQQDPDRCDGGSDD